MLYVQLIKKAFKITGGQLVTRIMEHHDGRNISMVNNIRKIWTNTKFYCVAPIFCKLPSHVNSDHSIDMFDSFGTNESESLRWNAL